MTGRKRAGRFAIFAMLMAVTGTMPVHAEPEPETGNSVSDTYSPRDYDGIVTDEMIEEWERENGTDRLTDFYGNDIEWDIYGSGNEEGAGYENSTDRMEAPTYSFEEQKEILKSIGKTAEITETGCLRIKGELGDNWPGYNVTVALYDKNHERVEITAYSQNDFEEWQEVMVGIYKVYRAYVPGDENGRQYPLIVSDSKIEVMENETAELTVWRAATTEGEKETKEQVSLGEAEIQSPSVLADMIAAISISIGVLSVLILGFAICKKVRNRSRYQ